MTDTNNNEILHVADEVVNENAPLSKSDDDENGAGESLDGVYDVMLTTSDNPCDPFDNFDEWFQWDEDLGYHTCAYVSRIARLSDEMSDEEELMEIERAIDEILANDFIGVYKKVRRKQENDE